MALTEKKVAKLREPGRYGDGHGLYLQVQSPTNRSWLFRYERNGRGRWHGLGPVHTFGLVEARERARLARQLLRGAGRIQLPKARASVASWVWKLPKPKRSRPAPKLISSSTQRSVYRKARAAFLTTLRTYAFPHIGDIPVADINTGAVLRVLEQPIQGTVSFWRAKPETASRIRGRIEAVLDWAGVRGYREGANPARWKGHLSEVLPAKGRIKRPEHHPALPYDQLPAFMVQLQWRPAVAARAMTFAILTAARTGEVIGAQWHEIDFDKAVWTVPAARAKMSREHRVPLSEPALKLLRALPQEKATQWCSSAPRPALAFPTWRCSCC